jgi:hypothetical protein
MLDRLVRIGQCQDVCEQAILTSVGQPRDDGISPATEDAQVGLFHRTGCHKMLTKLTAKRPF